MKITGTIINYYFHCKRQCYLFGNRINLENNSEDVRIGKVLHELKEKESKNSEIKFKNISIDKLTSKYVIELKKSDADIEAATMQVLFYLKELEQKGIKRNGKLIFEQKNKNQKVDEIVLDDINREKLDKCITEIVKLLELDIVPDTEIKNSCKKCAYYEYCYI